jgi:hypothetical protein
MRLALLPLLIALLPPLAQGAEETVCDRSNSLTTPSPDGRWTASVQEVACATPTGAAAGITVELHSSEDASLAPRVFTMPVPSSREDWPRVRWLSAAAIEIRVPNLAEVAPPAPQFQGIAISLAYCGDNPEDRARVAAYKDAIKQWQKVVSAWVKRRKEDEAAAGPRPPRPEEPRVARGRCTD